MVPIIFQSNFQFPMAALLLQPPIHRLPPARHFPPTKLVIKSPLQRRHKPTTTIAAAAATGLVGDNSGSRGRGEHELETIDKIKAELHQALQGINRGIFGVRSAKKLEIQGLVELLESQSPTPNPTDHLSEKVDGCWKLVYSTITILGAKRTKLGLRDFINLGDFLQIVDVAGGRAANVIKFNARGFKMLTGQLTINASFQIASKTRVDIKLENSSITPEQLFNLFQKNYDLLIAIFNPEGWLEITYPSLTYNNTSDFVLEKNNKSPRSTLLHYLYTTSLNTNRYVDKSMRIGRDDKGNIFVLEKTEESS